MCYAVHCSLGFMVHVFNLVSWFMVQCSVDWLDGHNDNDRRYIWYNMVVHRYIGTNAACVKLY